MEKIDKSHLAEMLGVEEDEKWNYPGLFGLYRVHNGAREYWNKNNGWLACDCEEDLIKIIARPDKIMRVSRLTKPEIAIMRAVGAKWVSYNEQDGTFFVELWMVQPTKMPSGVFFCSAPDVRIASVRSSLFPSVHPGECIELVEVQKSLKE